MSKTTKEKPPAPLYVTGITAEERKRLENFAEALGRPVSWVVRDSVNCYLDVLEGHVKALKEKLESPPITIMAAGETPMATRGRPIGSNSDK